MPTEVVLPKVDNDMTEGKITRWFVEDGARVARGDPLFEIETEKAAMEVEAPVAGTVWGIVSPKGGLVPVGSTLAWISQEGEPREPGPTPVAPAVASRSDAAGGTELVRAQPEANAAKNGELAAGPSKNVPATPLARRLAREWAIDLRPVKGSGPRGRIQRRDLPAAPAVARHPAVDQPGLLARSLGPFPNAPSSSSSATVHREWLRTGEGTPLVFFHGFGSELAIWRPLVSRLGLSSPILAIDLPGHGRSSTLPQPVFEVLVSTVEAVLAQEGVGRADLVGHSLGGAIAAAIAARTAMEPRSLFLVAPAGLGPEINGAFLAGFCRAKSEASLRPWMRLLVGDPALIGDGVVTRTLQARSHPGAAEALDNLAASLFPDGTQAFSVREGLAQVAVPTRVVFGSLDRIIPPNHIRGLPGRVAAHTFAGIGHMPHLEASVAVADLLWETIRSAQ